ncbi:MAG: flavin reductase family protein [Proteobacteria bacterium]|nr:flavin reductase family protein [Pseudomonadota bacterium]MBI3499885.1 flavin reductase family protein [Pseudomonadota bacterium]
MTEPVSVAQPLDAVSFRNTLGCFATGVTVATTRDSGGRPVGLTVNSFTSVSLDPPLILFCVDRSARAYPSFAQAQACAINVLGEGQQELSERFATSLVDPWPGLTLERWVTGAPIIVGCLAILDCRVEAVHEGGDHVILVAEVLRLGYAGSGRPLLFYRGDYCKVGPHQD